MFQELAVFSLLLLLVADDHLRGGTVSTSSTIALAALLFALVLRARNEQNRIAFINQLKSHRKELRAGGTVTVDHHLLRYDSELSSYRLVIGVIFTQIIIPSRFRQDRSENNVAQFFYAIGSAVFGWWSLTGATVCLAAVLQSLGGGEKITVAKLIDGPLFNQNEENKPQQRAKPFQQDREGVVSSCLKKVTSSVARQRSGSIERKAKGCKS